MAKNISWKQLKGYWPLYFFVLPSVLLVSTFAYFPAASAIYHSFFRWNGDYTSIFVGFANYRKVLGTPILWLGVLAILVFVLAFSQKKTLFANIVKIFAGIACISANIVALLLMGNIYQAIESPNPLYIFIGIWTALFLAVTFMVNRDNLNKPIYLSLIAVMGLSQILHVAGLDGNLSWSISLLLAGIACWCVPGVQKRVHHIDGLRITQAFLSIAVIIWTLARYAGGDDTVWSGFGIISILVVANIFKMVPSIATAVVVHRLKSDAANYWYRVLFVVPMIIPGMVYLLIWKFFFQPDGILNLTLQKTGIMWILAKMDVWFDWGGVFVSGQPGWLVESFLVVPAFIIWGFPWVGIVGVLIYLAGLQSISESTYEAADLDGVTPLGKFFFIELPLIMTQVRINLVLMVIGTLQTYGLILILFRENGGPGGKLLVPGLYMFRNAFLQGMAGYACCIGMVIFVFILILTEINNRFVRVDK